MRAFTPPQPPLRVLLLDDRFLRRRGMEIVLSAQDGIEVVGAADRSGGVDGVARLAPDVVILDPSPEVYRKVRQAAPNARVLMLGQVGEAPAGIDVAPGDGPLDRTLSAEDLASAVRRAGASCR